MSDSAQGIAFPPRIGPDGRLVLSAGADNVRDCIEVILRTAPGERLRLRPFGAGLGELRFAPNAPATHREIAERIRTALARWEPRARVDAVDVRPDASDPEAAVATVTYRLVATAQAVTLAVAVPVGVTG
jgi:phage baseplate assembly protein W